MKTKVQNIPDELKSVPNWVCWKSGSKVPRNPHTGGNAMSNNRDTWGTFEEAVEACERYNFDGLGFEFAPPYFGVDLDHCIHDADFVDEFVKVLGSYAEISTSGDGLHIICKGVLPAGARRKGNIEMYSENRYFICTGNLYDEQYKNIVDCSETIKILRNKYMPTMEIVDRRTVTLDDQDIIDKAGACKSGVLFNHLYEGSWEGLFYKSHSEADLALCNMLAFWTKKNEVQMDRIFRTSGLMREKWDRRRGDSTYGAMTIQKACSSCREVYEPQLYKGAEDLAIRFFQDGSIEGAQTAAKIYHQTDSGNAQRLYDRYGKNLKYLYSRKKWYYWNGKKWILDELGEINKLADMICADLNNEAENAEDEKEREKRLKFARRTENSTPKKAMINECQHLEDIPALMDDFDSYPDYLNVQNGMINLITGAVVPHDKNLLLSKIAVCDIDNSDNKPVHWLKFIDDVTAGNKDLQEYLQRCVGYSLTGSTKEQCLFFLYGLGNNGKSTFLNVISDLMGDYAMNAQSSTIMMQKNGGGASSDVARLKGARIVTLEEITDGARLNEGLIKQLTGGDKVTARFLFGDEFEYVPDFKLWFMANHKPVIRGTDTGIWRRIRLIPFEVNIPDDKKDLDLKYKLRAEYPQILAWAVEGAVKWYRDGLPTPKVVSEATAEYKNEMDLIAAFVEDCIVIDYTVRERVMGSDLFAIYRAWAKAHNEWEMSAKRFGMEMAKKTPEKVKTSKGVAYGKIRLTEYAEKICPKQYDFENFS